MPESTPSPSESTTLAVTVVESSGQLMGLGLATKEIFPQGAVTRFLGEVTAVNVSRRKPSLKEVDPLEVAATLPAK